MNFTQGYFFNSAVLIVRDDEKSVSEYVKSNGGIIKSMVRYEVGEGLQKREENFAEEVAKQMAE